MDARVTEDTQAGLVGNQLPNVPYSAASVWTRYNLIDTCCDTVGIGAGVIYVGQRAGDAENTFVLPSYSRWDSGLYWRRGRLQLGLYAENLFDAFYISSSRNTERNSPGAPFNLRGSARIVY
jgi:iron complex outermembrane receptor protein